MSECLKKTARQPIGVRWIDINKGDNDQPNYRSRLVAREINTHKGEDVFAATPPLEAIKAILLRTATASKGEVVMVNDISRAYFHARTKRDVYVQLADEDRLPNEAGMCGKLKYSMYGTRGAAQNWLEEYSNQLRSIGFKQGKATPCVFYHPERQIRTMVHGDDHVSTGMARELRWMKQQLEAKYKVKTEVLGQEKDQLKQVKVLNRIRMWQGERGHIRGRPTPRGNHCKPTTAQRREASQHARHEGRRANAARHGQAIDNGRRGEIQSTCF